MSEHKMPAPVAWRCNWNKSGKTAWVQYHDEIDPLPETWDVRPNEVLPLYAAETVDALQAENERLRADVERLRTDGASAVRWAPSSAHWSAVLRELFGPNARDGIDATEARLREERERAERLAEALREAAEAMKREAIKEQIGGLTKGDPEKIARADRLLALIDAPKEASNG